MLINLVHNIDKTDRVVVYHPVCLVKTYNYVTVYR